MLKKIPGTKDILPPEVVRWQRLEETARNIFSLYNFREIRPPIVEEAVLFNRSLGENTEIVQKQMFLVKREGCLYALRPEGTASVVRAFIENNLDKEAGLKKLYYIGAMFRAERPQKGRLRQFHHVGAEVIGASSPNVDVEVISLAHKLLTAWGASGFEIIVNTLGCQKDKKELIKILQQALKGKLTHLCDDCRNRFKNNVLRILDCKKDSCREAVAKINIQAAYLCQDCLAHFAAVKDGLGALKIKYAVSPYLVRGLDYYTRTVFEIRHSGLGAQDALGAGGRYDNLVKELGGPDMGAMGFAFGVERILLAAPLQTAEKNKGLVYVIALGQGAQLPGLEITQNLRNAGIPTDTNLEDKSLKGAMRQANDLGARFVLILGDDELKKDVVTLKDMDSGEQKEIQRDNLIKELQDKSKISILPNPK